MGDEAAGEFEEGFVDVGSAFPADVEAFEAVKPGEAAFDDPAVGAQSSAMEGAAAGDCRDDPALADLIAVDVVVVPAVGEE
ncbi:hypothetical protein JI76_29260 [Streptomyces anulatus]|nr:hypothetical protein JI76_29260 [Streptomyces anulatus]